MVDVMNNPVLVLNATYEPITFAPVWRAMSLLIKGKAVMEREVADRLVNDKFEMPSVVRLAEYRKIPYQLVIPKRDNVFLRDGYICQYCFQSFPAKKLTLDHVIPRAQGGKSTWENLVACCQPCNSLKADRTPEQANMELLRTPRPLTIHTSRHMMRIMGSTDPLWREYLYH